MHGPRLKLCKLQPLRRNSSLNRACGANSEIRHGRLNTEPIPVFDGYNTYGLDQLLGAQIGNQSIELRSGSNKLDEARVLSSGIA